MEVADLTSGGAPLLGEPLPIELGNTAYAVRGHPKEGLETVEHLAAWLRDVRPRLAIPLTDADLLDVTPDDLRLALESREAIRRLAAGAASGRSPAPDAIATLNHHARHTPRWHELRLAQHDTPHPAEQLRDSTHQPVDAHEDGADRPVGPGEDGADRPAGQAEPQVVVCTAGRPVAAVLAAIAEDAIILFGGPSRHKVYACQGPGCMLHFVRETRREWCSGGCGNRARAARHYAKVRHL
ncbi:CGNR zinc finger domain-containing protein [Nonomuraea sp. ZG12]|uniref:CGNR zinc finger domain-containing protein n=1 Tax=Nonomuraea sp. ZG12 TaxID=3452207 RepID=UPI003F89EB82